MRQLLAFLIFLSIQQCVFASKSTGTVVAFAFSQVGDPKMFSFALSSPGVNLPACNTTGRYAIDPRFPDAVVAISLLVNINNNPLGAFKAKPIVMAVGTGACSREQNTEDAMMLTIADGSKELYSDAYLAKSGVMTFALNRPLGPIIRNMSPSKAPKLKDLIAQYWDDFCKIGPLDTKKKWGLARDQLPASDESFYGSPIGAEVKKKVFDSGSKLICLGEGLFQRNGMNAYVEYVKSDSASAIWVDDGGQFHGAALFKEAGKWKIGYASP